MIEALGVRLLAIPIAAVAFAWGVRRKPTITWIAAGFATVVLFLAMLNTRDMPAAIALAYVLTNAAEAHLVAFAGLLAVSSIARLVARGSSALRARLRGD